jgi:nucleotide-binding universal stress UspA family protein
MEPCLDRCPTGHIVECSDVFARLRTPAGPVPVEPVPYSSEQTWAYPGRSLDPNHPINDLRLESTLSYPTLLVHLELGRSNAGLLQTAGDLAERFQSRVIGLALRRPRDFAYDTVYAPAELIPDDRAETASELEAAEAEFRDALRQRVEVVEWRSVELAADLPSYIARQARVADLIVTGVPCADMFDSSRAMNTGELILHAGRPVFLVPSAIQSVNLDRLLVGWKDTRETRRAIVDALPLLRRASDVVVVELAAAGHLEGARRHLDDVISWLASHGIFARAVPIESDGSDATGLHAAATREHCNIIVAGAYGHGRVREWIFGGVTKDLLLNSSLCSFVSH